MQETSFYAFTLAFFPYFLDCVKYVKRDFSAATCFQNFISKKNSHNPS